MSTDAPSSIEILVALEQQVVVDPMDAGKWLVYLDCCMEHGLEVAALVPLIASARELRLERELGFDVIVEVPEPESRCTVQIRLAVRGQGETLRALSARFRRKMPPLDWLLTYPWPH